MEGWNRIDLHQHTNHDIDCKGKKVKDNYTHADYYEWLKVQDVKLKAVTCHNNIDLTSHVKHAIISDMLGINHLVGAEIDYKFDKLEFHAITILSPNVDVIQFSNKLNSIRNSKGNSVLFNKDDFCKLHEDIEFIFIPHAIKDKGLLDHELEKSTIDWVIKALISGLGFPILFENTKDYYLYTMVEKIKSTLNLSKIDTKLPAYIGSDYKFDNDETRKQKVLERGSYCINSLPTYRGLEIALRNSDTRLSLESQIVNRERYIKSIDIINNDNIEKNTINFSPGLNVIIGNSGSGKTLLLNQIYFEIKNKCLTAAIKDNKIKEGKNPYEKRVGKNPLLKINFDNEISNEDIKIVEIPNIYSEILKSQNDDESLVDNFGINNYNSANKILIDYKNDVNNYFNIINNIKNFNETGKTIFANINTAIDFLGKNKLQKNTFLLQKIIFNDEKLNGIVIRKKNIVDNIDKKDSIIKYFMSLKDLLSNQTSRKKVDDLLKVYDSIIDDLNNELKIIDKQISQLTFEKKLTELINNKIDESINKLGNREKTVKSRLEILSSETNKLISNIKKSILLNKREKEVNIVFPYEKLKSEIETNSNAYARLTLDDTQFDVENSSLEDSKLFNLEKIKTKIKAVISNKYNLLNSDSNKKLIIDLNELDINLSDIINEYNQIPKNIELYLNDDVGWKLIDDINKGDIAKKSIEYYFNKLIREKQPDIILIDQPENDVDKSFISDTLSEFIKKQKIEKQIIVTSHDAIVAINSDANMIIEAQIKQNNKISYNSYCLEYVEEEKLIATNRVSLILDGGKNNIKKRYQIYGGELTYENRNI